MSRDLERQLDEMGPAYREVVARLRRAREVSPRPVRLPWRRVALAAGKRIDRAASGKGAATDRSRGAGEAEDAASVAGA